jgi:hypothetical protein
VTVLYRPPGAARNRLLAAAGHEPATRPGTWRRRAVGSVALAVAWMTAMLIALGFRFDLRELPVDALAVTMGTLVAIAGIVSMAGMARGKTMLGTPAGPLSGVAWGAPLALLMLVLVVDPRGTSTIEYSGWRQILAHSLACELLTVMIGAPLMGLGLLLWRGLTVARPVLTGAVVGLAASTWAHALMRVHCAVGGAGHAVMGHLLPALPLMLLGAAGMWAIARRPRSGSRAHPSNPWFR